MEEWIQSGKKFHVVRDHMNHCFPMNGGMWGGVKGGIENISSLILGWKAGHTQYMEDMKFLWAKVFPVAKHSLYQTDSYCCQRFEGTHPFPYQRLPNFEHVGQVFMEDNKPRYSDIDRFIRINESPSVCRKDPSWKTGR